MSDRNEFQPISSRVLLENTSAALTPSGTGDLHAAVRSFTPSVLSEYNALRSSAGLIDRSYLSMLMLVGGDSLDLLQRITTNDLSKMVVGSVLKTVFLTEKGRVVDLVRVCLCPDLSVLLISYAPPGILHSWIEKYLITEDVQVVNVTGAYRLLTVAGPSSREVLEGLVDNSIRNSTLSTMLRVKLKGVEISIMPSDALGPEDLDLVFPSSSIESVSEQFSGLVRAGSVVACGNLPVEIRRVELGIPRYGRELTDDVNPLEAGLEEHISFTKGCYVGQEVIARLKTYGKTNRRLVGFVFHSDVEVLPGTVVKANGHEVGKVTSSAYSIAQHRNIGLGYLRIDSYVPGVRLTAGIPGNEVECKTRELPPRD